ncbi:MAG TPA: hypothetical protein VGM31_10140 [Puia sp.]|jgi:hypothetical protein
MNKLTFATICVALGVFFLSACKKSDTKPSAPTGPSSTTQWTFQGKTYQHPGASWTYDTAENAGILSSVANTGSNQIEVAFYLSNPAAKPLAGTYYFSDPGGNPPSGVSLDHLILLVIGDPTTGTSYSSTGGTLKDSAIVTSSGTGKLTVFFSNISTTGGGDVTGTLIEL